MIMKKILFLLTFCTAALCASATTRYVAPTGEDANDGLSWATAKATIGGALSGLSAGDEVLVAAGTYKETVTLKKGVSIRGGYNASSGLRDIDLFKSILDGEGLGKFLIVAYSDFDQPTYVEGMIIQNSDYGGEGGGAFIRGNVVLDRCIIRNCQGSNGGGVYAISSNVESPAVIKNTLIELCQSTSSGSGAYLYQNAVMDGCIVRGCSGKYGAIRSHKATCIVRNCIVHNNTCDISGWPQSAGIFNEAGSYVINCTVVNNRTTADGASYAGIHSVASVYNSVFWGNKDPEGDADAANFISSSSNSSNNFADEGFDGASFTTIEMSRNNMDADGPNFNNPTSFSGAPTNAGEIAAMQAADYSLLASSPLINKGDNSKAPATDILGVARTIGGTADVGAYEYDPEAKPVNVTGIDIYEDTIWIIQGKIGGVSPIITPANATNKRLIWTIDDINIATVNEQGAITGVAVDTTIVRVETQDGGFKASAVVVILPIPPTKYPKEVEDADALYKIEDYTIPSFIPFWIAKEAARIDSLNPESDLPSIAGKIVEMNAAATKLIPKTEPYNMVATINGDPHTHMGFCWFTNEGVTEGKVQILAKANATAADFEAGTGVITIDATPSTTPPLNYAVTQSGIIKATGMSSKTKFTYVSHKALAENLTPGTEYYWRVGYEDHWSEIARFRTQDTEQGEYSFIYMTDSHIMNQTYVDQARICATAAAKAVPEAKFCLFPGDFVETGTETNSEWEWERWFEESIKPVIMQMPIVPTDGNHDDTPLLNYDYHFNTDWGFYTSYFADKGVPMENRPQFHGITYSFVYGDVLFLVFSMQDYWRAKGTNKETYVCSYLSNDVKNWFKDQVEKYPNTKYRVTLAHKNIFSGSGHQEDAETPLFRELMLPIMKECKIDIAIQGHDHCYEVIGPVNPDTRTAITSAISDVETVSSGGTHANMTGKKGGTFVTDDGTLYFIGATCGEKRYDPYSRSEMEAQKSKHKVENYYDLFTGFFGQPGKPSFTKFTVKSTGIEMNSYTANSDGTANLINTMLIKNRNSTATGVENTQVENNAVKSEKFIRDGQLYILKDGQIYNVIGQKIAQ